MGFLDIFKKKYPPAPSVAELISNLKLREDKLLDVKLICKTINKNWSSYFAVEQATGVPAILVAAIHYREASFDFKTVLHNGELLIDVNKYGTRLVPKGRGQGLNWSWVQASVDALIMKKAIFPDHWSVVNMVEFAEKYNGMGYRNNGLISPYCFAGCECYTGGLYVRDGKLDRKKMDQRIGVAAIIRTYYATTI